MRSIFYTVWINVSLVVPLSFYYWRAINFSLDAETTFAFFDFFCLISNLYRTFSYKKDFQHQHLGDINSIPLYSNIISDFMWTCSYWDFDNFLFPHPNTFHFEAEINPTKRQVEGSRHYAICSDISFLLISVKGKIWKLLQK